VLKGIELPTSNGFLNTARQTKSALKIARRRGQGVTDRAGARKTNQLRDLQTGTVTSTLILALQAVPLSRQDMGLPLRITEFTVGYGEAYRSETLSYENLGTALPLSSFEAPSDVWIFPR